MATRVNVTPAQKIPSASSNTHHYALKQVVGKGAYGIVYRAINRQTRKQVAIKVIEYDEEEELNEHMLEIDLLKNLKHENIVKYHGFIQKSHQLFILLEYCSQGSLRDLIKRGPVDEQECKTYIRQTLHGLKYLHEQGVIHRDIKAANLLLDAENVVKLADFGVSTRVNNLAMTYAGSPNWMAPEVMVGEGASTVSDIWSLGATVVEILTGNPPFHNLVNEAACYAIVHDAYIPPKTLSSTCRKFLRACFQKSMFKRPSAEELLNHEWLYETKQPILEKFKENAADDWGRDFIEVEVSPFKEHDVNNGQQNLIRLSQSCGQCNPHVIYSECSFTDIAWCLIDLCRRGQLNNVHEMFAYDLQYNSGRCRDLFIALGGISALLCHLGSTEKILNVFFIEHATDMIKCGILPHCKLLTSPQLILSIVSAYYEIVDFDSWCRWCSGLPNLGNAIAAELEKEDSLAEETLLRLSEAVSFPLEKEFVMKLMSLPLEKSSKLSYIIFKSFNNFLEKKEVESSLSDSYDSNILSTPHSTPMPSNSRIHNFPSFSGRTILPEGFTEWLLKLTPTASSDPHLLKNFIELCFNASHLNNTVLGEIVEHGGFFKLIRQLTEHFERDSKKKYTKTMLSIALNLCVELSQELTKPFLSCAVDVALRFLKIPEFITGGTEILLHCFLFAIHDNFEVKEDSSDILIHCDQACIQIPRKALLRTFYSEEPKFGNYITKFTKLCSLPPCGTLATEIVSHPLFMEKTKTLFAVYRSSLIIQIDFLKFLKLILTRYAEYAPRSTKKDITSEALISSAILQRNSEPYHDVISSVADFLRSNWQTEGSLQGQVGTDSVLIRQLCYDISLLGAEKPLINPKRVDKSGFVVPA